MSLYKDASLAMIPTAYKDGKLYSVRPTDGSGDFTFTRGSNLSATRVDASQLIEKGRENLLLYSNDFSNAAWSTSPITLTSGQSGYDGSNDAWEAEVAVNGNYQSVIQATNTSGLITNSIYAKAGNSNFLGITDSGGSGGSNCIFNLTDGSISYQNGGDFIETSSESIGNGWYRLKVTHQGTSPNYMLWFVANASNSTGGTAGDSVFIQDSQQENSLVATPYIESGATTGKAGILENTPRFDYSGGATCPSLLLEPSRTNSHPYSEYLEDAYWLKYQCSITANQAVSPDGYNNASLFTANVSGVNVIYRSSVSYGALSFFAKADNLSAGARFHIAVDTIGSANWNQDGTLYSQSGGLVSATDGEDYGNGWYRFTYVVGSGSVQNFGLSNSTSGDTCHIWGVQSEPSASYATSYIPNHGTSGGVTRAADSCISSSLTTSTDFTIFFEAKDFCLINGSTGGSYDNVQFVFSPSGGPYDGGGSYHIYGNSLYYYNGSTNTSFGLIYNNQTDSKFALVKRGNQGIVYANGVKKTELTLPSGADAKVINWDAINLTSSLQDAQGDVFGSNYKQLVKFDEALTDSELATLTTS